MEYNKQAIEGLEKYLSFHEKELKEMDSYDCLIDKYFKLIVENAGLENGKMYYTKYTETVYNDEYFVIEIYNNGTFSINVYNKRIENGKETLQNPKTDVSNEDELYMLMKIYKKIKYCKKSAEILKNSTCKRERKLNLFILIDGERREKLELGNGNNVLSKSLNVFLDESKDIKNNIVPVVLQFDLGGKATYYCVDTKRNIIELKDDEIKCAYIIIIKDFDLNKMIERIRGKEKYYNVQEIKDDKILSGMGITFEIEESEMVYKLIIE